MNGIPVRLRLNIWSMLVVVVALLVCGIVAAFFIHRQAVRHLDLELAEESSHFFEELHKHGGVAFDWRQIDREIHEWMPQVNPPRFMEVRSSDGTIRWRSPNVLPTGMRNQTPGQFSSMLSGEPIRGLIRSQEGTTFVIATGLEEARQFTSDVLFALLTGMPVALAFAWLGGNWVASRAVQPVVQITAAVKRISAERLDQRVPVPTVSDEFQSLAAVLNNTFDRLERSYQQALRFSADASHELKTPLTVMRASIEAVLDTHSLSETDHAAIAGLLEQTQRLSNITASLLLLARADAGRLALDLAEHDLVSLTGACVEDARIVAENRGVRVESALPARAPAHVDALRFSQIVSNLLDNAVKYNRGGGEVRVTLSRESDGWKLLVANTGPGIAPEFRSRLFERFFRVERTSEDTGCGLGLGLARELAIAHGGDVLLVRSDEDWTEFAMRLPAGADNGAKGNH
jgi:signal transduction histidine kinase